MYYTPKIRPKKIYERTGGKVHVETAGYISAQQQITNLIDAGERLVQYRKESYDIPIGAEDEDPPIDPTRNPNFDLADASELHQKNAKRLKNTEEKIAQEKATALQSKKARQEADEKELASLRKDKLAKDDVPE